MPVGALSQSSTSEEVAAEVSNREVASEAAPSATTSTVTLVENAPTVVSGKFL